MFGAATVDGVVRGRTDDFESSEPAPKPLRAGTVQANLVNTLHDYRVNLELLRQARRPEAVAVMAAQAVEAARTAETVADRVARQMVRSTQVQESVQRMMQQRRDLLSGLPTAVDEVGEIYAKLLELAATTDLLGMHTDEISEATQVSQSWTPSAECSPTSSH
jgi:urease gamma subunit